MNGKWCYILIGWMIFAVLQGCSKTRPVKPLKNDFNAAFTKVKEVEFDSNLIFDIRYMDVNENKDILITNRSRTEVFLTDSSGKIKAVLSKELDKGFPGANWVPYRAYFTAKDEIFVANGAPWGIWFDKNGNFKKFMPKEYMGTAELAFDSDDNIFSLNKNHRGLYISIYDSNGLEWSNITEVDSTLRNIMRRSIVGRHIIIDDAFLFYKNLSKPVVYKYDLNGNLLDEFTEVPAYYKSPQEDLTEIENSDPKKMGAGVFDFAKKYTSNYSIHSLDNKLLLVQYLNMGGEYGHQILTTDGDYVLDFDLYTKNKILAAKNGFVYVQQRSDTLPVKIGVYEYNQ